MIALPTQMLKTLNVLKARHWVEKLNPHGSQDRATVQEKQISAATRMFHSIFNELDYGLAFELGKPTKTEISCRENCIHQ